MNIENLMELTNSKESKTFYYQQLCEKNTQKKDSGSNHKDNNYIILYVDNIHS